VLEIPTSMFQLAYVTDCNVSSFLLQNIRYYRHNSRSVQRFSRLQPNFTVSAFVYQKYDLEPRRYSNWLRGRRLRDRISSPGRGKVFLLSTLPRPVMSLTPPPIQWVPGALSLGIKWLGREADHSPPTSAEVKNT
jgi:hypothetical protein